jgi:glycosyltransferase involved in cell wall biosynthesis
VTGDDRHRPVLMIYLEPAPYLLGFITKLRARDAGPIDVLFAAPQISQPWNLPDDGEAPAFLPSRLRSAVGEIRRRLTSGRYRVLHIAGWGHPVLLAALLAGWWYRVPVLMESDTQLFPDTSLWKRALKRAAYPWLFRLPEMMLPTGTRQMAYFRHYGVSDTRMRKAQMTADVEGIARRQTEVEASGGRDAIRRGFGIAPGDVVFVFVGRLDPRKGVTTALEAFDSASRVMPDAVLLIVGDGEERPFVERAVAANSRILHAGRLDAVGVTDALLCADVALVPSNMEQWGLAVNEAMAAALPVIASDQVGCVDDLVHDGRTGLVFTAGASGELADAMLHLGSNPGLRHAMGLAGRQLISSWTWETQAAIAAGAWNDILVRS